MTKADTMLRYGLFQAALDSLLYNHDIEGFPCMINCAIANSMFSMKLNTLTVYLLNWGWLGNPNLFQPRDKGVSTNLHIPTLSLLGGNMAVSDKDTQAITKMNAVPTVGDDSTNRLKRFNLVATSHVPCVAIDSHQTF